MQVPPAVSNGVSPKATPPAYTGFTFQEFSAAPVPAWPAKVPGEPENGTPYPFSSPSLVASVRQKRRGRSIGCIVLYILLAITLVFVGLGGTLYVVGSHIAAANAANSKATSAAAMQLYRQVMSKHPTFVESLANPDTTTWTQWSQNSDCTVVKNDGLHVHSVDNEQFYYCEDFTSDYTDFAFQVRMQVLSGDKGGLVFRLDHSLHGFYSFVVSPTGSYAAWIVKPGASSASGLVSGTTRAVYPRTNQADTLAVIAKGDIFDLYINQQFVTQFQDATFKHGRVGALADDEGNPTEVVYTNEQFWALGS